MQNYDYQKGKDLDFFQSSEHGGELNRYREQYGIVPLDFSVNVNPLGMPDSVRQAAERALQHAQEYPDPVQNRLTAALAEKESLQQWQILPGAGASDLIFRVLLSCRPSRAVITAPTFSEYERALTAAGSAVSRFLLREEDEFLLDGRIDELLELAERDAEHTGFQRQEYERQAEMIILCEPNNPTGRTTNRKALQALLEECQKRGILLVVDESFIGLTDEPSAHSFISEAQNCANLILLRSFTKLFAMPGIRLGYGIFFDREIRRRAALCGPSWPISAGAEAAGLAALQETGYIEQYREQNQKERGYLRQELLKIKGITFISRAEANYLLIHADRKLAEPLAERGILVRDCGNYHGLDRNWIRVCVRGHSDNVRLVQAVRACMQERNCRDPEIAGTEKCREA